MEINYGDVNPDELNDMTFTQIVIETQEELLADGNLAGAIQLEGVIEAWENHIIDGTPVDLD